MNSEFHQILHQNYILIIQCFGKFAVRILSNLGFLAALKSKINAVSDLGRPFAALTGSV